MISLLSFVLYKKGFKMQYGLTNANAFNRKRITYKMENI